MAATKLNVLRQVVIELATVYPDLTANMQIYQVPRIKAVEAMAPLEIQVCEGSSAYTAFDSCRSEDFEILVGIFRKYRLDSGARYAKALADLNVSIFKLKEAAVTILAGNFLSDLLARPLIITGETAITEPVEGQLLKVLSFIAGLNVEMT